MNPHPRHIEPHNDRECTRPREVQREPRVPLRTPRCACGPWPRGPDEHAGHARLRDAPPRQRAPENAMLVLVPTPFGGLRCFERNKPGPLRAGPTIVEPNELEHRVQSGCHHTVVLCGARHRRQVVDAVNEHADLYLVPLQWLRDVPRDALDEMAAVAAKLVSALRRHPVRRRPRRTRIDRLF